MGADMEDVDQATKSNKKPGRKVSQKVRGLKSHKFPNLYTFDCYPGNLFFFSLILRHFFLFEVSKMYLLLA